MKVLFAASECAPFVKTGGLADVSGTLPWALKKLGMDVRVILPKYRDIDPYWKSQMIRLVNFDVNLGWRRQYCGIEYLEHKGVICYFVDNEYYFARDSIYGSGDEEGERFGFFCKAVLECMDMVGFMPDVLHCNDWQTGMIPVLLRTQYRFKKGYGAIKTVFTIHNLRFQGIFPWMYIDDLLGVGQKYFTSQYLEFYGCLSYLKGAVVFSDKVTTVSPTYAEEITTPYYGERLDGLIKSRGADVVGILNGIDRAEYDPQTDALIPFNFSIKDLSAKAECKRALQQELGLEARPEPAVIGIISRLTDQKGLDLVECVLEDMMRMDVQLAILGTGSEQYHELFNWASWRYKGRVAFRRELNFPLAHRIYAGSDMLLIPSQFEPCGLTQMIAMSYGTIPIVRETGGLKDSVKPYNKYTGEGNGFSFANYNAHEMLYAIQRAKDSYDDRLTWSRVVISAMETDFSWETSAAQYCELYESITQKS